MVCDGTNTLFLFGERQDEVAFAVNRNYQIKNGDARITLGENA